MWLMLDRLARLRIGDQALVGMLVLAVEHARQRSRGAGQLRVGRDVVDTVVAEPHHAAGLAQPFEELLTGSRPHDLLLRVPATIVPLRLRRVKPRVRPG